MKIKLLCISLCILFSIGLYGCAKCSKKTETPTDSMTTMAEETTTEEITSLN